MGLALRLSWLDQPPVSAQRRPGLLATAFAPGLACHGISTRGVYLTPAGWIEAWVLNRGSPEPSHVIGLKLVALPISRAARLPTLSLRGAHAAAA